jgi:mycothiol synthase
VRVDVVSEDELTADLVGELGAFVARVEAMTGRPGLSDHLRLDLERGGSPGFRAATGRNGAGALVGYAQRSAANDTSMLEVVVEPARHDDEVVLAGLLDAVTSRRHGAGVLTNWWIHDPSPSVLDLAARRGFVEHRRLHEMRRSLPVGRHATIETRPFDPDRDVEAWLDVNNRSFAGHEEQGGWTRSDLEARLGASWFDASGFLVYDGDDGSLGGFCWTKVHPATTIDPALGEIYVIGIDPSLTGRGLGTEITLAGLDHLHGRGLDVAMLHVDAGNRAAMRMYEALGFEVQSTSIAVAARI